jgi:hypothetical protein
MIHRQEQHHYWDKDEAFKDCRLLSLSLSLSLSCKELLF